MNNEPVAWMVAEMVFTIEESAVAMAKVYEDEIIPLYTHPVKELDEQFKKGFQAGSVEGWKAHKFLYPVKELTDGEIEEVFQETIKQPNFMMLGDTQRFARAILRKAQEK